MKTFVRSGDITGQDIFVIAAYPDGTVVEESAHGPGYTIMYVPDDAIETRQLPGQPPAMYLKKNWRESSSAILDGEATRRINAVFSEADQRAALAETQTNMMTYGVNVAEWPSDARANKATYDAGWKYIADVKQTADAMKSNLPANPSDDSHWPLPPPKIVV